MMSIALGFIVGVSMTATIPHINSETHIRYQYVGWFENDTMSIVVSRTAAHQAWFLVGDDGYNEAEICSRDVAYVCVFSAPYAFAFPRQLKGEPPDEWIFRDVTFELVKHEVEFLVLGRRLEGLYLIRTPAEATLGGRQGGKSTYTLYSPEIGVIAFGLDPFLDGDPTTIYWSTGEQGFGAIGGTAGQP